MAFPVVAPPLYARQVFEDRGEGLDVSQVVGPGNIMLQGQSLIGQFYGTFVSQDNIAAAGTTQGTATQITKSINRVTTLTTGSATGVILPSSQPGFDFVVINSGTSTLNVYPQTGEQINTNGVNAAQTAATGTVTIFYCVTAGTWWTK
jgi:hypothetical protein